MIELAAFGEAVMSVNSAPQKIPDLDHQRPDCPVCGLPMWLTEIEYFNSDAIKGQLHFECKACEVRAVLGYPPVLPPVA